MQSVLKWLPNDDFSTQHFLNICIGLAHSTVSKRTLFSPAYLMINLCFSLTGVNSWISVLAMAIIRCCLNNFGAQMVRI